MRKTQRETRLEIERLGFVRDTWEGEAHVFYYTKNGLLSMNAMIRSSEQVVESRQHNQRVLETLRGNTHGMNAYDVLAIRNSIAHGLISRNCVGTWLNCSLNTLGR